MEWKFKELTNSDTKVDPSHLEFFRSEALDDVVSALIREDIQNRLDAKVGVDSPLKIRYYLSTNEDALCVEKASYWLTSLEPHLNAPKTIEELGAGSSFDLGQVMHYLTIEGFNTSGLKGNPEETKDPVDNADRNDFYWFIRNVGRTGKKAGDRGRWGLGKIVYPASSNIRSFFCYSVREGDFRPALIGRSVLAIHAINGPEYVSEGYFAKFNNEEDPEFAMPEENIEEINRFIQDFKINRNLDQAGVSLVIPFPEESITYNSLTQCIIKSYFWEVLRGTLEVEIIQGNRICNISKDTINDVVMSWVELDEKDRECTQRRLEFCRKADQMRLSNEDFYFELSAPKSYGSPRMHELFESDEVYQKARECYRAGHIIAMELGVSIKRKEVKNAEEGSFLVYLQKDDELDRSDETFIRDGLTIIGESYIREVGVRALVLAELSPLNEFLGDAENPAHTKWISTTKHFHGKYSPGKTLLEYVQRSAMRLANSLGKVEDELLEDLLDDIFGVPTEHNSTAREKKPGKKRGRKKPPKINLTPRTRYLEKSKLNGGFRVFSAINATKKPDRIIIKMAYEAEGIRDPFSEYHPADFNLIDNNGGLCVEKQGCKELRRNPNLIELAVEEEMFSISITGFDLNRDLKIDAKPYIDKKDVEEYE